MAVTVWKGQLTFGLVSIPIRIVRAARQERVKFTHVYRPRDLDTEETAHDAPAWANPDSERAGAVPSVPVRSSGKVQTMPSKQGQAAPVPEPRTTSVEPENATVAPLRRMFAAEDTGEAVPPREVLKGYEYEKGRFAVFHPKEMRRLRVETSREMEIIEFVKLDSIDPVYFNASYYVIPDRGGDKPYALLFEAMRRSGYAALARFAMHGREQILALRPGKRGILMHTLFFESEIHGNDEFAANTSLLTAQELKLAELLIGQLAGEFDASKFKDERAAKIQESIQAKIASAGARAAAQPGARQPAEVVDILDLLRQSLGRKPAGKEMGMKEPAAKRKPKQGKAGA